MAQLQAFEIKSFTFAGLASFPVLSIAVTFSSVSISTDDFHERSGMTWLKVAHY